MAAPDVGMGAKTVPLLRVLYFILQNEMKLLIVMVIHRH